MVEYPVRFKGRLGYKILDSSLDMYDYVLHIINIIYNIFTFNVSINIFS